jgi:hypothetical protein
MLLFGIVCTVAAVIGGAVADTANAILTPAFGQNILAGQALDITWSSPSPGPITITLRYGATTSLSSGTEIAGKLLNHGVAAY